MALTVNIAGGMDLDQGGQVNLSATVTENGLPPLGTVVYAWSADRGSFVGATDQAAATYEADFSDASDVDVTITCAVTRAAESNPTIASASLSSMAQLGITNPVLNMYVTDTEQGTNGSYTVWWQSGSADSSIDGNSDSELSSDLTVSIIQWNPTDDRFSLNTTGTGNLAGFFSSNTTQSVYVILNDGSYYEITNAMYGNGGGNWVRWDITDATMIAALDAVGDNTTLAVGVADAGSIGWAADSGSGTSMFTARHVGGSDRRLLHQTTLPPARRDDALIPVAIQDPNDANNVLTYRFTKDDLITFVTAGIEALTSDDRLDYNSLKNTPATPPPFKVSDVTTTTPIADDDRLVFSDTSETDRPNRYITHGALKSGIRPNIQEEGVIVSGNAEFLNFIGDGITASVDGTGIDVTVDATTVTNVFNTFTETQVVEARDALGLMLEPTIGFLGTLPLLAANTTPQGITYIPSIDEVWVLDSGAIIYRYNREGVSQGTYNLASGNDNPQGIAYISSIDEVWVTDTVDSDAYRYNTSGVSQGTYNLASGNDSPVGITYIPSPTDEVWIADADDNIYRYNTSGVSQGTYALDNGNTNPTGIGYISDVEETWVVNGVANNVDILFRYNTSGESQGIFDLNINNTNATGITYVSHADTQEAWVVDSFTTDLIYRYAVLYDITLTPARVNAILADMNATQRDEARTALGLQGTNLTLTASNNQVAPADFTGEIIIAKASTGGGDFTVAKGSLRITTTSDVIVINYT